MFYTVSGFFPIPDPEVKTALDHGSATLCEAVYLVCGVLHGAHVLGLLIGRHHWHGHLLVCRMRLRHAAPTFHPRQTIRRHRKRYFVFYIPERSYIYVRYNFTVACWFLISFKIKVFCTGPRWARNGTRLTAGCHFTGPQKVSIPRAQPPPTCPRNGFARIKSRDRLNKS